MATRRPLVNIGGVLQEMPATDAVYRSDEINVTNDATNPSAVYPVLVPSTGGYTAPTIASAKISFVPSTGTLTSLRFSGSLIRPTSGVLTAAGTTQATGLALTSDVNYIGTTAANTGVVLPAPIVGKKIKVINRGASDLRVYPPTGSNIDNLAANAAIILPTLGVLEVTANTTTQYNSTSNSATGLRGVVPGTNGGTGVNNSTRTISYAGNVAFTGAFTFSGALTANTSITFPTTGTLVSTTVAQTLTNKTFTGYTETTYALAGTDIAVANGTIQRKTLTANTTFTETLADGQSVVLHINPATFTVTWPTISWINAAGTNTAPTLKASVLNVIVIWQDNGVLYGNWIGSL
jgi:hypothetical protein